jgi:hypothetical protein
MASLQGTTVNNFLRTLEQVRATGWYGAPTGSSYTGLATEMGVSSGQGYILCYNRDSSSYGVLNLSGSASNLQISGSNINVTSGALQQGGNQVLHAGNYTSYPDATKLPLAGGTMTGSITGVSDTPVSFNGGTCTAASYNYVLNGANDTGNKLVIFINGSSRTADGGVNALTIRNDGGAFVLGLASYLTSILGSTIALTGNTTVTGQLNVNHSTPTSALRLYSGGSTIWSLGVGDASGSYFNITADFGSFTINKTNGYVGIGTTSQVARIQLGSGTPTSATDGIQFGGDTSARLYRTAAGVITCPGTIAATFSGNVTGNVTGSSGSCTGNAATATTATSLNSSNYIARCGSSGNANTDFQNTPAGSVRHNGDDSSLTNSPGGTWWFYDNYRHSNNSNYWGIQVAWGWEDQANKLATRNVTAGTFGSWVYYLNSVNYNSYSPTLTGTGASGTWSINVTGNAGGSSASCTGNAATVTNGMYLSGDQFISGAKYFTSNKGATSTVGANNTYSLEAYSNDAGAAGMSFHRGGYYAVNMGLDPDNVLRIGGWSAAANRLQLDMSGNLTVAGNMYASIFYDSDNNSYYANPAATSNFNELTLAGVGTSAYGFLKYGGTKSGDWQSLTTSSGQINVVQVENIGGGGHTNYPTGVYTYGGVMSWRTTNHSFQLYAAHTGDLAYKTQWNNDNYSGWRRILDSSTYPRAADMNQYVRTTDNVTFGTVTAALSGNATTATTCSGNAGSVTYLPGRTDATAYPVLWGAAYTNGSGTIAYSCAAVTIQSSTGTLTATSFSGAGTGLTGTAASLTAGAVTNGVYTTGNQTIAGTKTFSSAIVATNAAKAWVHFNGTGNVGINANYNVSSITDNGTGDYTVNFTSAFVDTNYVVAGTATIDYTSAQSLNQLVLAVARQTGAQSTGSCRLATEYIHGAALYDAVAVRAVFYR